MNKFRKMLALKNVQQAFDIGTELFNTAYEISKDRRTSNVLLGVSKVVKKGLETYSGAVSWHHIQREWHLLTNVSAGVVPHVLLATSLNSNRIDSKENYCSISEIYNIPIAFLERNIYTAKKEDVKKLTDNIGRLLMETWGPRCQISKNSTPTKHSTSEYDIKTFEVAELVESEVQLSILSRIDSFKADKKNRSFLLYGPPGTGKTCIANSVAAHVRGTCMVVDAKILFNDGDSSLIDIMRPDTLIIHDIDHVVYGPDAAALSALEKIHKIVPVIVMTANSTDLNKAFLRPERFDEVIPINQLGKKVFDSIMGHTLAMVEASVEVVDELKEWPAAFLVDLASRIETLGVDSFEAEFEDLRSRIVINNRVEPRVDKNPSVLE